MNTIYLNGIYQAKSEDLIKIESINNLDKVSLITYLKNINYGNGTNYNSFDNILNMELKNIRDELKQLSGSNLIGDIFYLDEDLTNIKIVYKSAHYNIKVENYSLVSRFDIDELYEFFANNNDNFINNEDLEIFLKLKTVDNNLSLKEQLETIEVIYYDYIYNLALENLPFLIEYIETRNLNKNLLTFLKFRMRKDNEENLSPLLLPQNSFDKTTWLELFDLSNEVVMDRLSSLYYGYANEPLKEFFETKNITPLKIVLNERLTSLSTDLSYQINNVGGVINFLHLKQNEINNLRWLYYVSK